MSETPNEGAGGVSVDGQDEAMGVELERFRKSVTAALLDPAGCWIAGWEAALVESEARERELEKRAEGLELERNAAESTKRSDNEYLLGQRAVLVEALKLALIEIEPEGGTDPWRDTVIRRARSALAGVVEAEPDGSER